MRVFTETGHVSDDSLALHILNDLPLAQGERIAQHLLKCSDCRGRQRETGEFLALFRALAQAQTGRQGRNCSVGKIRIRPRARISA